MTTDGRTRKDRIPLWRERVLRTALTQADATGLEGFTMRRLADVLDVAPMALYRHVANKEDLLDGMIDLVFGEVKLPAAEVDWKDWMRGLTGHAASVVASALPAQPNGARLLYELADDRQVDPATRSRVCRP